ncbi:LysR family transcriptional regulator [Lederbergia citrea]|uniref:LysR family transcriptional regulator n=1 Tax=Lederbergia citrea TaxID=2833581 RepID=A0A942UTB2_9BACI|nr:LysR family transcriptional regulator [Lederbergia citrea]MBS4177923.1 LysR family transcriptional regulator [Lederbergia citrea]MBS4204592.1 LysR family transcriptional regulator [Lederbergia citrea]MBS4223564.1 LysR family transcriptional regulator [Lederbergia citrea]
MELRQIQYFIEVAKREHMTDAADALHVAQSAVSRQIVNLEAELGINLFIREGRNIRLTPIGRMFLEKMQQAMDVIEQARREIEECLDPEKGTVRIGFPSSLAAHLLPTVISAFRKKHPDVKFQLHQDSYRNLIDSVLKGDIDMALLGPLPMEERRVKSEILFMENLVALLSSNHPLAGKSSIPLDALRGDSFILSPKGYILRDVVINACKQYGFEPAVSFEGKDIDAIKGLVSAGLGVTLLPEITLVDSLPRATAKVRIAEPRVTRTVGVIIPKDRELMPTELLFYQFLRNFFNTLNEYQ